MNEPTVVAAAAETESISWIDFDASTDAPPQPGALMRECMSLAEAEQLALAANPAVGEARARVAAAHGNWVQVGLYPNPTIAYSGEEIGNEGSAGFQGGYIQQRVVTGHKLQLSRNVALQQLQAAQQELAANEFRVLTDVRTTYFQVLISQQRVELTRQLVGIGEKNVTTNERLVQAAEVNRIAVLQARIEVDNARIVARNAENALAANWRQFAAVVGQPHLVPQPLAGDPKALPPQLGWEEAAQVTLGHHPLVAQAAEQADQARWQLKRARAEVIPDIQVQAGPKYNDANGDTVADVQIALSLPLWNKNQGAIRQAQAEIAAAEQALGRVRLGLQEQLAVVYRRYADAQNAVTLYDEHILSHSEELYRLAQRGFEAGELNYLDLLTAQRSYFQANLGYLDSLGQLWQARFEIDGLLLSGSLRNR
jgi:cobalt-zinc-cadmium efflux system outer membrane protein